MSLDSYSFTKADRLRKRAEFVRLSNHGGKIWNRHFLLVYGPGPGERTRLGVTVTRKVGGAVVRNRLKRLCREYFRLNRRRLSGRSDLNIIPKRSAAGLPSSAVFASLDDLFDRMSR